MKIKPGLCLIDISVTILYDILCYTQSQHISGIFLRVDFGHSSIRLIFFGFGEHIIRWIAGCFFYYIKSSVLVNGNGSSFDIQRGYIQRDLLSPYIFLLCVEILAGIIRIFFILRVFQ